MQEGNEVIVFSKPLLEDANGSTFNRRPPQRSNNDRVGNSSPYITCA